MIAHSSCEYFFLWIHTKLHIWMNTCICRKDNYNLWIFHFHTCKCGKKDFLYIMIMHTVTNKPVFAWQLSYKILIILIHSITIWYRDDWFQRTEDFPLCFVSSRRIIARAEQTARMRFTSNLLHLLLRSVTTSMWQQDSVSMNNTPWTVLRVLK